MESLINQFTLPPLLVSAARIPAVAVGLPLLTGWLSGYPTSRVVQGRWFKSLAKPALYPPRLAFPLAWTALYLGMGWASHVAAQAADAGRPGAELGLKLYYIQLGLNLAWTPLFFGAKRPDVALFDMVPLTGLVYYTTSVLHQATDGWTTYALAPYCAWLTFATYLNGSIWFMNRGRAISKED